METSGDSLVLRPLSKELENAKFGDQRLTRRLGQIADGLASMPTQSIPKALGGLSELEATYRFLGNEKVTPWEVLRTHVEATAARSIE